MNSSWVLLFPFFLIHRALIKAELFPNAKHLVSLQQKPFQQLRRREAASLCQDPAALVIAILITGVKESQNFNPRLPGIVVWAVVLQQHSLEIHQVQTEMWEVRSPFPTFQSLLPARPQPRIPPEALWFGDLMQVTIPKDGIAVTSLPACSEVFWCSCCSALLEFVVVVLGCHPGLSLRQK